MQQHAVAVRQREVAVAQHGEVISLLRYRERRWRGGVGWISESAGSLAERLEGDQMEEGGKIQEKA